MLIFFLTLAHAVSFPAKEVNCPYLKDKARIFMFSSSNQLGGYDSDLASYSKGEQFRTYAISTCYDNYFSLYGKDFSITLSEEQKKKIELVLAERKEKLRDPTNPQVWERYEIAAEIYRILDYPPEFIAQVYIEASWTVRDTFVRYSQGVEGPKSVREILTLGDRELLKELTHEQRKLVIFNLARIAHRGGYSQRRDAYLNQFSLLQLEDSDRAALQYVQNHALPQERYYQEKALLELKKAIESGKLKPHNLAKAHYLYGDITRRLGRVKDAIPYYKTALTTTKEERLLNMAQFFLEEL